MTHNIKVAILISFIITSINASENDAYKNDSFAERIAFLYMSRCAGRPLSQALLNDDQAGRNAHGPFWKSKLDDLRALGICGFVPGMDIEMDADVFGDEEKKVSMSTTFRGHCGEFINPEGAHHAQGTLLNEISRDRQFTFDAEVMHNFALDSRTTCYYPEIHGSRGKMRCYTNFSRSEFLALKAKFQDKTGSNTTK